MTRGTDGPGLCTPACPLGTEHRTVGRAGERRDGWLGGWRASSGERPVTACALLSAAGAVTYGRQPTSKPESHVVERGLTLLLTGVFLHASAMALRRQRKTGRAEKESNRLNRRLTTGVLMSASAAESE